MAENPKIWISSIEFNDGSKIALAEDDIIVFVGPNNAGKSASLKEAYNLLADTSALKKVLRSISISKEGTGEDLTKFLKTISFQRQNDSTNSNYSGLGFSVHSIQIIPFWDNYLKGLHSLANVFAKYLKTEERLTTANPAENIKLNSEPIRHPINLLQKSDILEIQFSNYFKQAFGLDLIVHRNAGQQVPLYVGNKPEPKAGNDRLSYEYQNELEKLDLLHEQGDGMRSFVGVLLNAFVAHLSILFIDEPEAFLHPPQARLLGKMLAKDLPSNRQLFLATHSTDFLKGLLDSNNSRLKVIRIQREANLNKVSVLNNIEIKTIWNDSLLRHSNILDGLFHTQVIICESDSDNKFYSAMLAAIHEKNGTRSHDTLFLHCGGKQRLSTVIKALKQLNVSIKIIADFDILNNILPLQSVYQEVGGKWEDVERDWKIVKSAVESKKPELETIELKKKIEDIFASTTEKVMPKEKLTSIGKTLKKASAWDHAKEVGKSFIPSGDATKAFERIQFEFRMKGLFIVEVGELEGFARSVGNHGPKWVNEVLMKDLILDPELELARKFILEVSS